MKSGPPSCNRDARGNDVFASNPGPLALIHCQALCTLSVIGFHSAARHRKQINTNRFCELSGSSPFQVQKHSWLAHAFVQPQGFLFSSLVALANLAFSRINSTSPTSSISMIWSRISSPVQGGACVLDAVCLLQEEDAGLCYQCLCSGA